MSSIDPANQLAALIRAQIGAQARAKARKESGGSVRSNKDSIDVAGRQGPDGAAVEISSSSSKAAQERSLQQLVALRVRALSPDDPQRPRKAFRIFLESVLTQEFGRDRASDPGFHQLIDQVMHQMEGDEGLNCAVLQAGEILLKDLPAQGLR